jgi:hypothetical protein
VGLEGTSVLVVCEEHLNVMLWFDEEARFVSDHSKNSFVCRKRYLYFFLIVALGYLKINKPSMQNNNML